MVIIVYISGMRDKRLWNYQRISAFEEIKII